MAVTIYDVAREAGVSTATVSKVLSGRRYVADGTRARVLAAVDRLDYTPNLAARGLAGARTQILVLVFAFHPDFIFSDPHLLQIMQGVDEIATTNDYALLLSTASSADNPLSAYKRIASQHNIVDGAVVGGTLGSLGINTLEGQGYPIVVAGYRESGPSVHTDDRQGARQMTEHLLALGHERIGVISGPESDRLATGARLAGYREALSGAAIQVDERLIAYGDYSGASGYGGAARVMAQQPSPTALFAFSDRMALGAMRWLREQGVAVPGQVSVAGFDDIPAAAIAEPPLTTVRQMSREQGRRAALLVLKLINNQPPSEGTEISLPAELVVRASTAPPPRGG